MCIVHGNYDHDVIGVGNSQHPANQEETEQELSYEELQSLVLDLKSDIRQLTNSMKYRKETNKKIVEACQNACGDNTYVFNKLKDIR